MQWPAGLMLKTGKHHLLSVDHYDIKKSIWEFSRGSVQHLSGWIHEWRAGHQTFSSWPVRSSKTLVTFNYAGWLIINKDPLQRLIIIPRNNWAILQSHQTKKLLILRTLRYGLESEHVRFIFTLYKVEEIRSRPVIFWLWPGKDLKDFSSSNCHTFYPKKNTLLEGSQAFLLVLSHESIPPPLFTLHPPPSHDINPNYYSIIQHHFFSPNGQPQHPLMSMVCVAIHRPWLARSARARLGQIRKTTMGRWFHFTHFWRDFLVGRLVVLTYLRVWRIMGPCSWTWLFLVENRILWEISQILPT